MRTSCSHRRATVYAAVYALLLLTAGRAYGQVPKIPRSVPSSKVVPAPFVDSIPYDSIPDSVRQKHMLHVSPHLLVFNPATHTAIVELSNSGNTPTEGDIETQLGFTYWQNQDTALYPPHGQRERGRDTVIFSPKPEDRFAGQWISGLPDHIILGPHERRRFTLRLDPPANVPNGEYYARIITTVGARTKRTPVSGDTRQAYNFPIKGWDLPLIRDSVRVFYRKGPQTMGLKIVQAKAEVDTSKNAIVEDVGARPLRTLVQVHLTGTSHFEGVFHMSYVSENGDEMPIVASEGAELSIHRDGIIRWSAETDQLPSWHRYHILMRFIAKQDEFPGSERLPMQPVEIELPIKTDYLNTAVPALVSTGQDLPMGVIDPYWFYLKGVPDYSSSNALTMQGIPMVVDTMINYNDRKTWQWYSRSFFPGKNVNDGWDHVVPPEVILSSPPGANTARTYAYLPNYKGKIPSIRGHIWSEGRMADIYVNGRRLSNFAPVIGGLAAMHEGEDFTITEADGLMRGGNALDFAWNIPGGYKYGLTWFLIRVDFYPIFRETHDR